jgi:hypothetical protein
MQTTESQEMKHTPEPWEQMGGSSAIVAVSELERDEDGNRVAVAQCGDEISPLAGLKYGDERDANAARIVSCVNACAGLADPAEALRVAREALELAELWLANSVPVTEIDGPKPLPVVSRALAMLKGNEK